MIVLINSSKTMVSRPAVARTPDYLDSAAFIQRVVASMSIDELCACMHISESLAQTVHAMYTSWSIEPTHQTPALDAFQGDIYRGLRADTLSVGGRERAVQRLRIISGLYGTLRADDGVMPYRLEPLYNLPGLQKSLYAFWADQLGAELCGQAYCVNLASVEFSKLVVPYLDATHVYSPLFLTQADVTSEPTFVAIHAKVARGALARYLFEQVSDVPQWQGFNDFGYVYEAARSTALQPVFVRTGHGPLKVPRLS